LEHDGRQALPIGHGKDLHPDGPQVKVMLSALNPLGLPVATDVERGIGPLYVPAIARNERRRGKRRFPDLTILQEAVDTILTQYRRQPTEDRPCD